MRGARAAGRGRGRRTVSYGSGAYGGAAHRSRYAGAAAGPRSLRAPSRPELVELLDDEALLPAIVFIFSRVGCDAAVRQLLESGVRLTTTVEQQEIAAIMERHVVGLSDGDLRALDYDVFAEALSRGVAAHHAGMLPTFKECVEEAFVRGLIKVVFATETLALGINMPARSVVLEKLVKFDGETHADVTPGEYTQLTGRAGRRGIDVEGHAVVLWQPGLDPRAVAGLASRRTYPLQSSFCSDLQHGRQFGGQRRAGAGAYAAGAVLRAVPVRPFGGRGGPHPGQERGGHRGVLGGGGVRAR